MMVCQTKGHLRPPPYHGTNRCEPSSTGDFAQPPGATYCSVMAVTPTTSSQPWKTPLSGQPSRCMKSSPTSNVKCKREGAAIPKLLASGVHTLRVETGAVTTPQALRRKLDAQRRKLPVLVQNVPNVLRDDSCIVRRRSAPATSVLTNLQS